MHHKRKRSKNRRAGCLLCKPHKGNGSSNKFCNQTRQEQKARISEREQKQGTS
jgi:hypothetical protein